MADVLLSIVYLSGALFFFRVVQKEDRNYWYTYLFSLLCASSVVLFINVL